MVENIGHKEEEEEEEEEEEMPEYESEKSY